MTFQAVYFTKNGEVLLNCIMRGAWNQECLCRLKVTFGSLTSLLFPFPAFDQADCGNSIN